jgi:hypothetical protein
MATTISQFQVDIQGPYDTLASLKLVQSELTHKCQTYDRGIWLYIDTLYLDKTESLYFQQMKGSIHYELLNFHEFC